MRGIASVLILSMGMSLGSIAYADEPEFLNSGNTVTIEKRTDAESGLLLVVKSEQDINLDNNIYAMCEEESENGIIIFKFDMPEEKNGKKSNGEYDIYYSEQGEVVEKTKFTFSSKGSRDSFLEKLRMISSKEELKEILSSRDVILKEENEIVMKSIGCRMIEDDILDKVAEDLYGTVCEKLTNFADIQLDDFKKYLNNSVVAYEINLSEKSEIEELMKCANLSFEDVVFEDISDDKLHRWIRDYIEESRPYSGAEDLLNEYKIANILYLINNTRVDYMTDKLDKYAEALGIRNSDEYKTYEKKKSKRSINEKLVSLLKKSPVKSVGMLKKALADASAESNKGSSSSGGGSSSSGSNSFSSGGMGVGAIAVGGDHKPQSENNVEIENIPDEKFEFTDIKSAPWAEEAVNNLLLKGIIAKDPSGLFRPDDEITREEFVKLIVMLTNSYDENAEIDFTDVKKDAWYYSYVASAYKYGIINGISDNEFGVGLKLTRQDMAVLCKRAYKDKLVHKRDYKPFADESDIMDYAEDAVKELYCASVINGIDENNFSPRATATRAQCAVMLNNLFLK